MNRGWLTGHRPDVRLEPYGPEGHRAQRRTDCIVKNVESPEKIAWLTRCPVMESAAFNVRVDGSIRGIAVCYIKTAATGIGTGRIAHVSFLGEGSYRRGTPRCAPSSAISGAVGAPPSPPTRATRDSSRGSRHSDT